MSNRGARRGALGSMRRFLVAGAGGGSTGGGPSMANLYKAPQSVDNFVGANPVLSVIADQPQAKWINTQGDADNMGSLVTAAAGKTLLICIYAIPGRDNGQYSAGGFPDRASYLSFCQTVKTKIGNAPAFIFYEPDALGLTNNMSASTKAERIETLRQGVNILATIPNAETYIDASKWISPADQATLQQSVDISKVAGIVMNVSGYDSMDSCYSYGESVLTELANKGITGKKYMIDTSRNGVGPLTEADRPLASQGLATSQAWCNPPKRRLGPAPQVPSGRANCRGLVWVKSPGESDGSFPSTSNSTYYGENAPSAGTFWLVQAKMLAGVEPASAGSTPTTRTNFIPNPSYEGSASVASAAGQRFGTAAFSRDTAEKVYGAASLKVDAGTNTVDSGQWESVTLAAGTYTASVWIKTASVQNAHFVMRDANYLEFNGSVHVSGTTAWTRYTNTFTLTASTTMHFLIGLGSYGSTSSGTAWFDGLMIEQASSAGTYFDGSYSVNGAAVSWSGTAHASTSTEQVAANASGVPMPTGNVTNANGTWVMNYFNDFSTNVPLGSFPSAADSQRLKVYPGYPDTSKNGIYDPPNTQYIQDSKLTTRMRTISGTPRVGATLISTQDTSGDVVGQTYGRYSLCMRGVTEAGLGTGYKIAFLLWPTSENWPTDGEIDFPETGFGVGAYAGAFHHFARAEGGQDTGAVPSTKLIKDWHVYTIEWMPGRVSFFCDGDLVMTSTNFVPAKPMRWTLQCETNLDGFKPPAEEIVRVEVDWVAQWSRS